MQTDFVAPVELIPEYQALLDHWHSHDEAMFAAVMQKAADFHISRSKQNTDHTRYEFDATLDQVFPPSYWPCRRYAAARACQFKTDHLLIDTPWAFVRDMPPVAPHPLAAAVEARLVQDYPQFR
ncbi:hypothetical protein [Xanthomonas cucurbitae]|uniref:hypothetical protein n=1 Tax=Xanthomonas cucurbitae TaxID=56453 RepID=UPI00133160AF|nr:hypothetical protein [Xanthomonas cucurbitae]